MMAQIIDRKALKAETRDLLRTAQVSPLMMTALYLGIMTALDVADVVTGTTDAALISLFVSVLTGLVGMILSAGFCLYCMAIRRSERAEVLTLFDGFSFVGKIIALNIVISIFVGLWSMLFVIPGIVASYRYRFALYNLYENPDLGILEALAMSKQQTYGYKGQLLMLDLSYFGWSVLATLPMLVMNFCTNFQTLQQMLGGSIPAMVDMVANLSPLAMILVANVWTLVVSLFYLPHFQCTELGYYEIAQQTSGVRADSPLRNNRTSDGPDNMGGW
ncbi:MAG: DUF975 family protein [Oscillibacter sp.]|nr:DUF975 family protein [Oscillibacter sp.]